MAEQDGGRDWFGRVRHQIHAQQTGSSAAIKNEALARLRHHFHARVRTPRLLPLTVVSMVAHQGMRILHTGTGSTEWPDDCSHVANHESALLDRFSSIRIGPS